MANVLPLPQIPPGPAKRSGNGAPSDLDSLFEAMDLNRDGFLDAGGEHPSNCLAQSGGAMGDWQPHPPGRCLPCRRYSNERSFSLRRCCFSKLNRAVGHGCEKLST